MRDVRPVVHTTECTNCPVPGMRVLETTALQWGIQLAMCSVLRSTGDQCASEQEPCSVDVGGHQPVSRESWPGESFGVRAPWPGETPLSWAEVHYGMRVGDFSG